MGVVDLLARALTPSRTGLNIFQGGFGSASSYGGSSLYPALSRTYGSNELIYACIELLATSAAEPHFIGHRLRRNSPGMGAPRDRLNQLRREQVLQGRHNRANAMMADASLITNAYMEETPNHPAIQLLNNPNPLFPRGQFWATIARDLLIAGDAFIYKARYSDGLLMGAVGELWRLRPDKVKPKRDQNGILVGWIYSNGREAVDLPLTDVLHMRKGQSPFDELMGWGPTVALMNRTRIDNYQTNFLAAFYETGGTGPGAILNVKGKMAQKDKDDIRDRNRRQFGPGNFLELMIIDQSDGVTYQPLSLNRGLRDALPVDINSVTETRIAAAYGIPGSILGLLVAFANGAYAARKQDWQTLWDITMTPFLADQDDEINRGLISEFGGIDEACRDLSDIKALAEDKYALHDNARKNVAAGIWTMERGRLETGEPAEAPTGEHYLLPNGFTLAEAPLQEMTPSETEQPAQLMARAVQMMLPPPRVGRPSLEEDEGARAIWVEAQEIRAKFPGMTWEQIAGRVGVTDRTLRRYRDAFEDDED